MSDLKANLSRAGAVHERVPDLDLRDGDASRRDPITVVDDPPRPPEATVGDAPPRSPEELEADIRRMVAEALAIQPSKERPVYAAAKRTLDVVTAAVLIALTLPVIGVLALIIRIQSPGPAIFRQRRVGRGGEVIRFYKFRTMYSDAKERFPELYDYTFTAEQFATSYYKPSVDPRNTPFGRALRKTTLDELPNLFNVIKGDVSLVGPRPELPELIEYYSAEQLTKFSVPSGITGLAQTSGRNNLSIQEQITLDVEYVQRRSFRYDLRLIGRTAIMVVKRVGAE